MYECLPFFLLLILVDCCELLLFLHTFSSTISRILLSRMRAYLNKYLDRGHNLDFFAAFTPDTGSSDKRKSGYLKPEPGFDKAVRQAAPSTSKSKISIQKLQKIF